MLLRCFGNGMCYKGLCHLSWEIIPQSPTPHGQGQVQCNQRWHGVRKRLKCCSRVRMKCVGQANAQWWGRGGGCRQPWQRAEQSKVSIFQCPAGPSNSFRKMPWLKEGTHAEGERGLGEHPPLPQVMGTLQSTEWKRRFFCFSLEASPPPPLFWTKQNVQKPAPRQQPRGERAGGGEVKCYQQRTAPVSFEQLVGLGIHILHDVRFLDAPTDLNPVLPQKHNSFLAPPIM